MNPMERFQQPEIMACPLCQADALQWSAEAPAHCGGCDASFPLHDGWPLLLHEERLVTASAQWGGVATVYSKNEPACGFPAIDGPLIESCRGDVLEVGCGNGRLMKLAENRCLTLVGIDPSPEMTAEARKIGFSAITAAAEELPFRSASFDQVISGWASMRYTDQSLSFPEVARVLRPGGTFTFTLWNQRWMSLIEKWRHWSRGRRTPRGTLDYFRDRDISSITRLKNKLAAAQLPVVDIRSTVFPDRLAPLLQPLIRHYRGSLGARLGNNVILTCSKSDTM